MLGRQSHSAASQDLPGQRMNNGTRCHLEKFPSSAIGLVGLGGFACEICHCHSQGDNGVAVDPLASNAATTFRHGRAHHRAVDTFLRSAIAASNSRFPGLERRGARRQGTGRTAGGGWP
jgi:hypothetical protein